VPLRYNEREASTAASASAGCIEDKGEHELAEHAHAARPKSVERMRPGIEPYAESGKPIGTAIGWATREIDRRDRKPASDCAMIAPPRRIGGGDRPAVPDERSS
jgi:hypothetical protein